MRSPLPAGTSAGMLLFSVGIFLFALTDALAKWLVVDYPVGELLLLRTAGAALLLGPLVWRNRAELRLPDQCALHLARVLCMAADSLAFYLSTRTLPLADVMTFYLAAPLIITAISVPILGERVGPFRWLAVLAGFAGVLVALRPTSAVVSAPACLALGGAFLFAFAVTITRKLRQTHWLTLVAFQFAVSGAIGGLASASAWVRPDIADLCLMLLIGIVSVFCFGCITKALALAPAALLAPFQYASIVWAMLLGWVVWGDVPSAAVMTGSLVIVGSGLAILARETIPPRERSV